MNDNAMAIITMAMWLLLPVLATVSVAAAPWTTDRHELFGVTVPRAAFDDTSLAGLRRYYSLAVGCFGGLSALTGFGVWRGFGLTAALWSAAISLVLITAFGFVWLQRCRREVIAVKAERGWKAVGDRRVAVIDDSLPKPLPLWCDLAYIAIIAATVIVGYAGYAGMPQYVPIHMNMVSAVDVWVGKSPWLIWLAPVFELVIAIVITVVHVAVLRAKRPVDPLQPQRSAWRHAVTSRAWSVCALLVGVAATLGVGLTLQLGLLGLVPLDAVGAAGMFAVVLAFAGCTVIAMFYGWNGFHPTNAENGADDETMPRDDDRYWYAGVFYFNPGDSAVWVPKRFGTGWTVNLARPSVWFGIVAFLALLAVGAFVLAML